MPHPVEMPGGRFRIAEMPLNGYTVEVSTVARILRGPWGNGHRPVAPRDYEDRLPWNGRIGRL